MGLLEDISKAVEELEKDTALELVQKALDEGVNPPDIINSGIVPGFRARSRFRQGRRGPNRDRDRLFR